MFQNNKCYDDTWLIKANSSRPYFYMSTHTRHTRITYVTLYMTTERTHKVGDSVTVLVIAIVLQITNLLHIRITPLIASYCGSFVDITELLSTRPTIKVCTLSAFLSRQVRARSCTGASASGCASGSHRTSGSADEYDLQYFQTHDAWCRGAAREGGESRKRDSTICDQFFLEFFALAATATQKIFRIQYRHSQVFVPMQEI